MYIFGKNVALEAIRTSSDIKKVYLAKNFRDDKVMNALAQFDVPIVYVDQQFLDKRAQGNHQGIVLEVKDYEYAQLDDMLNGEDTLLVMLDHLEDPHNLGAIIRSCEAAGVDGIILPRDRSVGVTPTVMKVSTGAVEHMKICQVTNLNQTIRDLQGKGFWVVGTDMDGQDYKTIDYTGKCIIVIGNEGFGMSRMVKENCDFIASIPMYGKTNSLNASVATGIIVFEAVYQRKK